MTKTIPSEGDTRRPAAAGRVSSPLCPGRPHRLVGEVSRCRRPRPRPTYVVRPRAHRRRHGLVVELLLRFREGRARVRVCERYGPRSISCTIHFIYLLSGGLVSAVCLLINYQVRELVAHEQHVEDLQLQGAARRHQWLQRGEQARRGRLRQRLLGQDVRRPPGNT